MVQDVNDEEDPEEEEEQSASPQATGDVSQEPSGTGQAAGTGPAATNSTLVKRLCRVARQAPGNTAVNTIDLFEESPFSI
jgi:hypothetical protein